MRIGSRPGMIAGVMLAMSVLSARPAAGATVHEVDTTIKRAVKHLYDTYDAKKHWETEPKQNQEGGETALAVYALLAAGESPQNAKIKSALDYLKKFPMKGVYAVGVRSMVWHELPRTAEIRALHEADKKFLESAVKGAIERKLEKKKELAKGQSLSDKQKMEREAERRLAEDEAVLDEEDFIDTPLGMFDYTRNKSRRYDHSVSQYGVLGLWACVESGLEVSTDTWKLMDAAWRAHQFRDGSWSYILDGEGDGGDPRASMTAAGVASLFITQQYIYGNKGLNCTGNQKDLNIERGLAWMSKFSEKVIKNDKLYTLYGVERIGVASGLKYFGTVDWYETGADRLAKTQKDVGGWGALPDTCFGILFLVRGRAPVMMNKLEYAVNGDPKRPSFWNQRPRDVANLAQWLGKQIEKDLNWQIVNLKVNVNDLHDSQILYISGKDAIVLTSDEEAKLKQFVEQGGMILGHADCGNAGFSNSFKNLGKELFNNEFRELPESHPIYTTANYRREEWKNKPSVLGMSNGARELMLLIPFADPGKSWQTQSFLGADRAALAELAGNIFLYSVDKQNLRYKGDTYIIQKNAAVKPAHTVKLARLEYPGNWNPEPGGWRRLGALLHNRHLVDLKVETVQLGSGKLDSSYHAAHLTGTGGLALTPAQRQELVKYVKGGGTLIVDAAGGDASFNAVVEAEMHKLFPQPKGAMPVLAVSHEVFSAGYPIKEVQYRNYGRVLANLRTPRLRGGEVDGRTAVFLSNEDLSVGLVGQPVDGIHGYIPNRITTEEGVVRHGATEVMANIVLHAAKLKIPPTLTIPPAVAKAEPAKPAAKKPEAAKPGAKPSTKAEPKAEPKKAGQPKDKVEDKAKPPANRK